MGSLFQPLVRCIAYDSPLSSFKKIYQTPPAFLLESSRENLSTGRYSFIGTDPYLTFEFKGNEGAVIRKGKPPEKSGPDPFPFLQRLLANFRIKRPPGLPPFFGGAAGFFGYDVVRYFEKLPNREKSGETFPDIYLLFVDTVIAFDHLARKTEIIYYPSPEDLAGAEWETLRNRGEEKISSYLEKLSAPADRHAVSSSRPPSLTPDILPSISGESFEKIVRQCQEYIRAGDIFQANLSQRFSFKKPDFAPVALYERLQRINPSPFSSFLDGGSFQIVSSSPERLVSLSQGMLSTRPIAGTHPRGGNPAEDERMRSNLMANEKERAEHMMLIDLERNDLGKVSEYGSVKVDEFMGLESYSHVIHIVSNIIGKIKPAYGWYEVLKALFPGGTITGVPKIRAMEIIDELEPVKRGPYTGSLGYISFSGDLDLNILIRTLFLNDKQGFIQTGAGIVADSVPEKEYEETLHKAEALFRAVKGRG
jgi:para-aminobenzoate synthetase component 1